MLQRRSRWKYSSRCQGGYNGIACCLNSQYMCINYIEKNFIFGDAKFVVGKQARILKKASFKSVKSCFIKNET